MKMRTKHEVTDYINSLKGYEGYIQYSDSRIREEDVFETMQDIKTAPTDGFVLEAHFFNGQKSVAVRQINDSWIVDTTENVPLEDSELFFAKNGKKVRMAQIWEEEEDPLCENMRVKKLQKVVFAGFVKGESHDNRTV